jgi:dsRNA-specific ribonuclease
MAILFSAMWAVVGPKTLATISREWGVEMAAEPGQEVDPGLLQLRKLDPGTDIEDMIDKEKSTDYDGRLEHWRQKGMSTRIVFDDEFGEDIRLSTFAKTQTLGRGEETFTIQQVPVETALANQVRAVFGAVYLHAGRAAVKSFFKDHILSRKLDISRLFEFRQPTRDLSRLCAREGFEAPVARLISETGRLSRHPVFVVGVYSGHDKLGEGTGASLDEARIKAAISALKGWYLYSPLDAGNVPSDTEGKLDLPWKPVLIDGGEVIV